MARADRIPSRAPHHHLSAFRRVLVLGRIAILVSYLGSRLSFSFARLAHERRIFGDACRTSGRIDGRTEPQCAVIGMCILIFLLMTPLPAGIAALQLITPPLLRGQISALYMVVVNFAGLALGPVLVALLTDYVFHSKAAIDVRTCLPGLREVS
jgi:MFS family permease